MFSRLAFIVSILSTWQLLQGYHELPLVSIDLNAPPSTKWAPAVSQVLQSHPWEYSFGAAFSYWNKTLFDQLPMDYYIVCETALRNHFPTEYAEIVGLSNVFRSHGYYVSVQYLAAWVYYHELGHIEKTATLSHHRLHKSLFEFRSCTGVLMMDMDGFVYHGRNMDQGTPHWQNVTLTMHFMSRGKLQYIVTDYYWFNVGFVTGFKPNMMSFEENWRFGSQSEYEVLSYIASGRYPTPFVLRRAFELYESFDAATKFISSVPLISPMYFVVSGNARGPLNGQVVTRSPNTSVVMDLDHILGLNKTQYSSWFIVQTNYDHWLADNPKDDRRTVAETILGGMSANKDRVLPMLMANLMAVMSSPPVQNPHTIYTTLFCVAKNISLGFVSDGGNV